MTLINSDYEEWRLANPAEPFTAFRIDAGKMNVSGALFDMNKLNDISKDVIARFDAKQVYRQVTVWAEEYDQELYAWLRDNEQYATNVFGIGRTPEKPRKDIAKWSDVKDSISYYNDEWYGASANDIPLPPSVPGETAKQLVSSFLELYDSGDDREVWFDKMKQVAEKHGFAKEMKLFKKNPESYAGHVGDVAAVIRSALTGRLQAPDLYDMMNVMGEARVRSRLGSYIG